MDKINYIFKGFGYSDLREFNHSLFSIAANGFDFKILIVLILGSLRYFIKELVGLDLPVFIAFVILIICEFWTGIKVSIKNRGEKVQSRKLGRMIIKIGTYSLIVALLNTLSKTFTIPDLMGFNINPFTWLFYTVFIMIVFQMVISWFENLGQLGYKETKTIAGLVLRKFNKWFEFDGNKSNTEL